MSGNALAICVGRRWLLAHGKALECLNWQHERVDVPKSAGAIVAPGETKVAETPSDSTEPAQPDDPSDAAFTRLEDKQPVPAALNVSHSVSEIIKLATAGVGESVLLAFVDRSESTFNLGADEIIFVFKGGGTLETGAEAAARHVHTVLRRHTARRRSRSRHPISFSIPLR